MSPPPGWNVRTRESVIMYFDAFRKSTFHRIDSAPRLSYKFRMTHAPAFDNDRYLELQTESILERVGRFPDKLYLEFGGKLLFDYHAARVLPGYDPNVKMHLLRNLKDR